MISSEKISALRALLATVAPKVGPTLVLSKPLASIPNSRFEFLLHLVDLTRFQRVGLDQEGVVAEAGVALALHLGRGDVRRRRAIRAPSPRRSA